MSSLAAVGVLLAGLAYLIARRRELCYLLLLLLVAFVWRPLSVLWIDLTGPIYSIQLFRDIGGDRAAPWIVAAELAVLLPIVLVFRPAVVRRLVARAAPAVAPRAALPDASNWVFAAFVVWAGLLFVDLARGGTIPLFSGIERWVFTEEYGGAAHQLLVKYGMFVGFFLGVFFAAGVQRRGVPDVRFLFVLLTLLAYLFLVGHRFSAFYAFAATFAMPYATVVMLERYGAADALQMRRLSRRLVLALQWAAGLLTIGMIAYALYVSLVITRQFGSEGALLAFEHRVLVQQGEMFVATYDRVVQDGVVDPAKTADALFVHPVAEPGRNSTIPYLMVAEVGAAAFPMIDLGLSYSGGFPEIFFELFGPWLAFVVLALVGALLGGLLYLLLGAILERRFLSVFFIFYVTYPFLLMCLSGMLNSFVNWKFPIKVGALCLWLLVEAVAFRRTRAAAADDGGALERLRRGTAAPEAAW